MRWRGFIPGEGEAWPWWGGVLLQLCLLAALTAAGSHWALMPEQRLLIQAQRRVMQSEAAARQGGRPPTVVVPAAERSEEKALCLKRGEDPTPLFMAEGARAPDTLRWQAVSGIPGVSGEGWSVSLTTDYTAVIRLLSALVALPGCLGLEALTLEGVASQLAVSFTLVLPDAKERSDDTDFSLAE